MPELKQVPADVKTFVNPTLEALDKILKSEPEAFQAIGSIIMHIASTYSDKYQSEITQILDTKALLTKSPNGRWANFHSMGKYIQRYFTSGFSKSENVVDLYKATHYIIFELTRRINLKSGNEKE